LLQLRVGKSAPQLCKPLFQEIAIGTCWFRWLALAPLRSFLNHIIKTIFCDDRTRCVSGPLIIFSSSLVVTLTVIISPFGFLSPM